MKEKIIIKKHNDIYLTSSGWGFSDKKTTTKKNNNKKQQKNNNNNNNNNNKTTLMFFDIPARAWVVGAL